ncbi:MAG TPA: sulfotransferase domain-containing protein [Rudaea sp.]|nr:sulfotransferase domain-containing protein [Rudaea sp.]
MRASGNTAPHKARNTICEVTARSLSSVDRPSLSRRYPLLLSRKRIFLVSYPRSGSTLVRKYFSLLQGRPQPSVYKDDVVDASGGPLTNALDGLDLIKSHQMPGGHDDVVYLVRDGRNATLSFLYMKFLFGNHRFSERRELYDALQYIDVDEGSWARHVQAGLTLGNGRRVSFLKYEDLIRRPEWFLRQLLEFAGTPVPPSLLGECVRLEKQSDAYMRNPYNGYLYRPSPDSIYDLLVRHRTGDYWRYLFDAASKRYFHDQGGTPFLLHFGYEESSDWWKRPSLPR